MEARDPPSAPPSSSRLEDTVPYPPSNSKSVAIVTAYCYPAANTFLVIH